MAKAYVVVIVVLSVLNVITLYLYFKKRNLEKSYKKFKDEIAKILKININNPLDDFLLHQLNHYIKNLEEKYKLEKYKRRNIFSILDALSEGVILVSGALI